MSETHGDTHSTFPRPQSRNGPKVQTLYTSKQMYGDHAEQAPAATIDKTITGDSATKEQSRDKTSHGKARGTPTAWGGEQWIRLQPSVHRLVMGLGFWPLSGCSPKTDNDVMWFGRLAPLSPKV